MTERPAWWNYPHHCAHGHEWGPGRVTVSWLPCICATGQPGSGHLRVSCQVDGCPSVWYRPAHTPGAELRH